MEKIEIFKTFSKMMLAVKYIETQCFSVKDFMIKEDKQRLNHTLESVIRTAKLFEKNIRPDSEAQNNYDEDVELLSYFIELSIKVEEKGKIENFMLLIDELLIKYNIKKAQHYTNTEIK